MSKSHYRHLVEAAFPGRQIALENALVATPFTDSITVWERELDAINKFITVEHEKISSAADAYKDIARHLIKTLEWPADAISILPQGSTRTQTLIAPINAEKFDIDAVCQIDISRVEAYDPMQFFEDVGAALGELEGLAKNRCWRINYPNERFYIDFTPSAPLSTIPPGVMDRVLYRASTRYHDTALAVVDTPTKQWKTSNPEGFAAWVNDQAERSLLVSTGIAMDEAYKGGNIEPVPIQRVPLSDTLRVAIRLFKRHRDASVMRGYIQGEFKPISVIIVTLLTQCYEGLADIGTPYSHPIQLLAELAQLLPRMVEMRENEYWIANPTVDGENFAERWNHDDGKRRQAFATWCTLLVNDLAYIMSSSTEGQVRERIQKIFACTGAASNTRPTGGLAPSLPKKVTPVPPTRGLA